MSDLSVKRLRFSNEADTWLKVLKTRTGLNPNILCRLGFCVSISEKGIPTPISDDGDSQREINRFTLLGEFDSLFVALLKQRLKKDGIPESKIDEAFRDHMHRGINLLSSRVKSISDVGALTIPR